MDRRLMIMPGHEPIRTTLNGLTGIYGSGGRARCVPVLAPKR